MNSRLVPASNRAALERNGWLDLGITAVIALTLGAILAAGSGGRGPAAKTSRAKGDLIRLGMAAEAYAADNGIYPFNVTDDIIFTIKALSTPVAYIEEALLPDFFGNEVQLSGDPGYSPDAYFYLNVGPEDPAAQQLLNFAFPADPQSIEEVSALRYFIFSAGPDRRFEVQLLGNNAAAFVYMLQRAKTRDAIYDPTNGLASRGDIILTHRGFLDEPIE